MPISFNPPEFPLQRRKDHQKRGAEARVYEVLANDSWRDGVYAVTEAARYFDRICDELIDIDVVAGSDRPYIAAQGYSCQRYRQLLLRHNAVDFAHLQVWAHRVLQDDDVAAAGPGAIRHLKVDEFRDTSRVHMRILGGWPAPTATSRRWATTTRPSTVPGASVSNLLEFPKRFQGCRTAELTTNYRSHRDIVGAVGKWMGTAVPRNSDGRSFRFAKNIVPYQPESHPDYAAVISVLGRDPVHEAKQLAELLLFLKHSGVVGRYRQAARSFTASRTG